MKNWAWLSFTACGIGLFLSGCGGGPIAPPVSPLAGNWLIVGPMPTVGFGLGSGFRLALTVDVLENQLIAAGFGNTSCGNLSESFEFPTGAMGTIATDGTFSLQTPAASSIASLSLQGTVPKGNSVPWPGNYTISFGPPIGTSGQGCDSPLTGAFTAISFPLVNGVYAGTGTAQVNLNGVSGTTSIAVQMLLQQGTTMTDSTSGKRFFNNIGLTGNIRVQGSACFSSGVMNSLSGVQGNEVWAQSTMDDGSTVTAVGTLTDPSESSITPLVLMLQGGKCGSSPVYYVLSELDRQS
jgi:hypothetical protein